MPMHRDHPAAFLEFTDPRLYTLVSVGLLIGGVVVIETVFAYPGLGRLLIFAIEQHDLPLLEAGMLVLTTIYSSANLLADISYAWLNPRIRHTGAA